MVSGNFSAHSRLRPSGSLRKLVSALARVGLKRVGEILDLPRAPLAARFGPELLGQLDRALGHESEPLTPRLPLPPYVAEQRFAGADRARARRARGDRTPGRSTRSFARASGRGNPCISLILFRTDGTVRRLTVSTSRPIRDAGEIRGLFTERADAVADPVDPGLGFDVARLAVLLAEPSPAEQLTFYSHAETGEVDQLIDQLSTRLGQHRVSRLVAHDQHLPELAAGSIPARAGLARCWLDCLAPVCGGGRSKPSPAPATCQSGTH